MIPLYHFESKSTGEIKPVDILANYDECKKVMATAKSIQEWNELREQMKKKYSPAIIRKLDASGYITEILPKIK